VSISSVYEYLWVHRSVSTAYKRLLHC
jgi:hypothetical protein